MGGATNDNRGLTHTTSLGHILPAPLLASSHKPAIADTEETPFGFRPTPSCQLFPAYLPQIFPRPQVGGRAGSYRLARAGGDAIRLLLIASPRSLTAFVRYRHDACLLTERMAGRDKRDEKNQDERRDGRRDDRMERPQGQEKRAGCRHPVSRPACSA